jgi:two-component system OmpR family sensor kinase
MTADVPGQTPDVPTTLAGGQESTAPGEPGTEQAGRRGRRGAPRRRRLSLRARLIALVVAVAAVALIAVDIVIPMVTRASLIASKDQTLSSVVTPLQNRPLDLDSLPSLTAANPLASEIGWSQVSEAGIAKVIVHPSGDASANPAIGAAPATAEPFTVGDVSGGSLRYRALAGQIRINGLPSGYLVAWIPMDDISATIGRLVLLEILISLGLLLLVGLTAGFVIRRELKPLEDMAHTADDIAAGHLDRRVDAGAPGTEVGRLGTAFNGMLDGIQGLLSERDADEERLRRFIADASHELRTPVSAIRGYTDLYRAGALPEEVAVDRAMDRMGFESRRMGALVEDLLTLTRADTTNAQSKDRVDLAVLLTGVIDDAAVIDRSRTWRLAGAGAPAFVVGDRLRLHQVFANLLGNVRTHTPVGTTATVSLHPAGNQIAVLVSDDGPGVGDDDLPKLFDRFFRVDPARSREKGGSGLGLSIVAAIVRAHGGQIRASHTPGGGLTITVLLPQAADAPADRPDATEPRTAGTVGSGTGAATGGLVVSTAKGLGRQQSAADSPPAVHVQDPARR